MAASMCKLPAKAPRLGNACSKNAPAVLVHRALVIAHADNARVTRTFREREDGSVEEVMVTEQPISPAPAEGKAVFVDDSVQPVQKKQDNMSKDMKSKLREEYYGFGGAENKAMSNNYFLWIVVIISVLAVASKLTGALG